MKYNNKYLEHFLVVVGLDVVAKNKTPTIDIHNEVNSALLQLINYALLLTCC